MGQRSNEPWTFHSSDHSFTGTFVPNYKNSCETSFSAVPGLVVPKISFINYEDSYFYFRRVSTFIYCETSISGRDSTSGIEAELQSPRTCDLRTIWWSSFLRDWRCQNASLQASERAFRPPNEIWIAGRVHIGTWHFLDKRWTILVYVSFGTNDVAFGTWQFCLRNFGT